jgi:hypothetical protein
MEQLTLDLGTTILNDPLTDRQTDRPGHSRKRLSIQKGL